VLLAVVAIVAAIGLAATSGDRGRRPAPVAHPDRESPELVLDPNTATVNDLVALPRLGPTLARRIVEAQADGPFTSPEDLRARVRGIGPATLAQIERYLRFDEKSGPTRGIPAGSIAIADAGSGRAAPAGRPPRKPPGSRTRKPKAASVALAAKADAATAP
jgi:competence protein ComEA